MGFVKPIMSLYLSKKYHSLLSLISLGLSFFLLSWIFTKPVDANNKYTYYNLFPNSFLNIGSLYSNFPYGEIEFDQVPFLIPENSTNFFSTSHADFQGPTYPKIATFSAVVKNPNKIFLLMNGGNTYNYFKDETIGRLYFTFSDQSLLTEDIIVGYNFRDWNIESPATAEININPASGTKEVLRTTGIHGENPVVVDMQEVNIPDSYKNKTLESITLSDISTETVSSLNPAIMLYGITVLSQEKEKLPSLVILPGLGASWNFENMILGIKKPATEWYMTPGVKVYDNLINTLVSSGYQTEGENKNLYVFNYDWTQPVDSTASELDDFITNVVQPEPEEKIDLIGHSLGGLVARTYLQKENDPHVDKVISVGSPHKGVPQTYYLWEGDDLRILPMWQRPFAGLLLHVRKPGYATTNQAIKGVLPVIKDLLPSIPYLVQNNTIKSPETMTERNEWLKNLNETVSTEFLTLITSIVGHIPESTTRWIIVNDRNWIDKIMGLWPDGKPTDENKAEGDKTVLTESSEFGADIVSIDEVDHRSLIEKEKGLEKILEVLGLSSDAISTASASLEDKPALIFQLASPATLTVKDSNNRVVGDQKDNLVVITNATAGKYQINIKGIGDGQYHLYLGQITPNKDVWSTIAGNITTGNTDNYEIFFAPPSPLDNPIVDNSGDIYLKIGATKLTLIDQHLKLSKLPFVTNKLIQLSLKDIQKQLDKKKIEEALKLVYRLRFLIDYLAEKNMISGEELNYLSNTLFDLITDLETSYVISKGNSAYNTQRLISETKKSQQVFSLFEQKLRNTASTDNTTYLGNIYLKAKEKMETAKASSAHRSHINSLGAEYLSAEGLGQL